MTQNTIHQKALDLLTRRDHTEHELMQKLVLRGYLKSEIQPIMAALIQAGLINHQRYAENYVHWCAQKGYGPVRLKQELQSRGIPDEIIAEVIEMTDNAWSQDARKLWAKHFKNRPPKDFKERIKQMRFLQYRGFTREQIEAAVQEAEPADFP